MTVHPHLPFAAPAGPASTATPDLPDAGWLVALAGLPHMGPVRLLALSLLFDPAEAWRLVAAGRAADEPALAARMGARPAEVAEAWRRAASSLDPVQRWHAHGEAGVCVAARRDPGYPAALADDLEPPAVVFWRGDPSVAEGPRVAIVGTRRCTRDGAQLARELGAELSAAGVCVVSGLALGIDGAAHEGALAARGAPPIAVVASGLDVVYPARHRRLWEAVAEAGLLLTEAPLGTAPESWRFPARNRIIAALADAVVVVESSARGGSMYTVDQALARDRPVLAVPGPVSAAASEGTNRLLVEGATPVRDATDVLCALGRPAPPSPRRKRRDPRPPPDALGRRVLGALASSPLPLDGLAQVTGAPLGELAVAVERLLGDGWLAYRGAQLERIPRAEVDP